MTEFSAHHISSRGLKYALNHSVFGTEVIDEKRYQNALLNVLTAQDFDSIPLVDCFEGEITSIGRRQLHDGDVEEVFILSQEEVSTMPQKSSVIRCIFEVLSNEHHIVFLTDEDDKIRDVVTIGMLTNPIIKEYLTLLIGRLYSEGWDFNDSYLHLENKLDYDSPVRIFEELKKLDAMVDNPEKIPPTDLEVSKQIVHILSLLQPLKTWDDGPESEALNATDYPLQIATPEYTPGTAGSFAQHPFGAVMENTEDQDVQDLAFRMFAKANNWDRLLLKTQSNEYTHLLEKDEKKRSINKLEIQTFVSEAEELDRLVHLFDEQRRPLCVLYQNSPYRGIINAQDIVFSEYNKGKTLQRFIDLEISIRDTYMHLIGHSQSPTEFDYYFSGNTPWKQNISLVYERLVTMLPEQIVPFDLEQFTAIKSIRNGMAHNDFSIKPEDEIDPEKTNDYLSLLTHYMDSIRDFNRECKIINRIPYTEFISRLTKQCMSYEHMPEEIPPNFSWGNEIFHLKFVENTFMVYLKTNAVIQHVENIKIQLEKRDFPWRFVILSYQEHPHAIFKKKSAAAKKKVAAHKKKAEAAARERANEELIPFLKAKIHEMLESKCNENTEMSVHDFRSQIQSIIKEAKETFSLKSNKEIIPIAKLNNMACSGGLSILNWCGLEHTKLTRTDDDGKETVYIKITNLHSSEEE